MLRYLGRNVGLPSEEPAVQAWSVRPKQNNTTDCGIFVMKYMDYLLQGFDISTLMWDDSDIEVFRYRIAIEIHKGKARRIPGFLMRQRLDNS